MTEDAIKQRLAEVGYNMGYGAKRQFASYDIVEKLPFYFTVATFGIGAYALAYDESPLPKWVSLLILVLSFVMSFTNCYMESKSSFIDSGKKIQLLYSQVRNLHLLVDSGNTANILEKIGEVEKEFNEISFHKQVFGSDIYAHYKLFGESQSKWFVDELGLTFFKDMVPASLKKIVVLLILVVLAIFSVPYLRGVLNG